MPKLPPDLHEDIVNLLAPRREFKLAADRLDLLEPYLSDWPDKDKKLTWEGTPYTFFKQFVRKVPELQLSRVLNSLPVGVQDEAQIAVLVQRLNNVTTTLEQAGEQVLAGYYEALVDDLSEGKYQLDSRFVQLTLMIDQGPEAQGIRFVADSQRGKFDSLNTLLTEVDDRALVLLGGPGSGKTTLLRRLQLERAWEEIASAKEQLVFFMPLNAYRGRQPGDVPPDPLTWLQAEWQLRHPTLPPFADYYQAGKLLLLLDGLNEMPHRDKTDYRQLIGYWQTFLQRAAPTQNTIVFSCRSLDYSAPLGSEEAPVKQVQVEPLSSAQIEQFVRLHLEEAAEPIWAALRRNAQQLALFSTPFFLRLLVDQAAVDGGEMPAGQAALLTGFVRRALYREIAERQHHLFAPDKLLSEDDIQQVSMNLWASPVALPADGILIPKLASLAFAMQDGRKADEAGQVRVPEKIACQLLADEQAKELIVAGIQLNTLDKDLATRDVYFFHQLIQEYFAARVLAEAPEPKRAAVSWLAKDMVPSLAEIVAGLETSEPLPAAPATGWEEAMTLAAAMTAEPAAFVKALLGYNPALAARCGAAPEVDLPEALVVEIQERLLLHMRGEQVDLRARIAAAEALGRLGDPRFTRHDGSYGDYLLPPFAAIAGGTYPIGADNSQYAQESPAHTVEIVPFEMAVFPVTNAEYALFMAAGGYEDERWWQIEAAKAWLRGESGSEGQKQTVRDVYKMLQGISEEQLQETPNFTPEQIESYIWLKGLDADGLESWLTEEYPGGKTFRQPDYWEDGRFNHPAQPVVGITWFEAKAYCAWLSAQTGDEYTLPTEVEWEVAAGGLNGRSYAYGNAFDTARCNTFETHIRRTTPVGVFPEGGTPEGIFDLSGNVWEWTRTLWGIDINKPDFPYPYNAEDGRENQEDGASRRVVRGGSWNNNQNNARAAYRYFIHPSVRSLSFGFRVVCRPPSHGH